MKLNENYVIREIGDVTVLLPVGGDDVQKGIACYNKTAAFIAGCLEKETTPEAIVAAVEAQFEGSREQIAAGVEYFLGQLRSAGALTEDERVSQ